MLIFKIQRKESGVSVHGDIADRDGWYQRMENNGWRLVSDRLIHHMMSDPITWETSRKKIEFHHNKVIVFRHVKKC